MLSANIHFNSADTAYFIKFGIKEHLEIIKSGELRFSDLSCFYKNKTKNSAIYDNFEGIRYLKHHENGKIEYARINEDVFISCFSYFKEKDVLNNRIFSPKVLRERNWSHVLLILESDKFRDNIEAALSRYKRESRLVTYLDYTKDQENLTVFNKSKDFEFEKEFRYVFYPENKLIYQKKTKRIVNIPFSKVKGEIIPINDFTKCFSIEN